MMNIVNVNTTSKTLHVEQYEGQSYEIADYEWVSTEFVNNRIIVKGLFKASKNTSKAGLFNFVSNSVIAP